MLTQIAQSLSSHQDSNYVRGNAFARRFDEEGAIVPPY